MFSKNNEFFFKNDSGVLQSLQEDMIVKTTGFKTRKNGFKRHLTYFSTHSQDFSWLNQVNKGYNYILLNFSYFSWIIRSVMSWSPHDFMNSQSWILNFQNLLIIQIQNCWFMNLLGFLTEKQSGWLDNLFGTESERILFKGSLISESFLLWLKSPKENAKLLPWALSTY